MNSEPLYPIRRIAVIGASHGTGALVLDQARERGYHAVGLSRRGDPRDPDHRVGDATRADDVRAALRGSDAVIVTVGAPARDASQVRAAATAAVVLAMRAEGVSRLVVQSSGGVGDSYDSLPWIMKHLVVPLYLARSFADHLAQEDTVHSSELIWTILRPGYLRDRNRNPGDELVVTDLAGMASIRQLSPEVRRADVARVALDALGDPATFGATLHLMTKRRAD